MLAVSISSAWAVVWVGVLAIVPAVLTYWRGERRLRNQDIAKQATDRAEAPAHEMTAMGRTAEVLASAAATLVAPLQATINAQQQQLGVLAEKAARSEESERKCQLDLASVRNTLREVTERIGIDPPAPPAV